METASKRVAELCPEGVMSDPAYVQDGKVTEKGLAELQSKMPHFDLDALKADPRLETIQSIFTVETLVKFVEHKRANA